MTRSTVCFLLALVGLAHGHGRSTSYSMWTFDGTSASVQVRLALADLKLAVSNPNDHAVTAAWVQRQVTLAPCSPSGAPTVRPDREGWVTVAWNLRCDGPPSAITTRLFADELPSHLHFARRRVADGVVDERGLTSVDPTWPLAQAPGAAISDYIGLGIEHIATGWDHVAFVLAFLLLATSIREVATVVSAFTVAHSVTLGLATLGLARPDAAGVEAVIGFSIALVALESGWLLAGRGRAVPVLACTGLLAMAAFGAPALRRDTLVALLLFTACHWALLARTRNAALLRALVAFGFGLIHGFGFAGILAEMHLPRDRVVPALLGFNLGVEVGQLAIVAAGWAVLTLLTRMGQTPRRIVAEVGSAALCGLGLFWFVVRAWG